MATTKTRVQTFLDDSTYELLKAFAQEQELSISSAVESIVKTHLRSEQPSEQPYYSLDDLINRIQALEAFCFSEQPSEQSSEYDIDSSNEQSNEHDIDSSSEQPSEQLSEYDIDSSNEQSNEHDIDSSSEQPSEQPYLDPNAYIICRLEDKKVVEIWGTSQAWVKVELALHPKTTVARKYETEASVKTQLGKLRKKFPNDDLRWNTLGTVMKLIDEQ